MDLLEDILNIRFVYHSPTKLQAGYYETLRQHGKRLALAIHEFCPDSRERSLAITKLEEAIFWANAAIARRTPKEGGDDGLPQEEAQVG